MNEIQYRIERMYPDTASDELLDFYIDFKDRRRMETDPRDPPFDREVQKLQLRNLESFRDRYYWIAWSKNKIIGHALLLHDNETDPAYEENKHTAFCLIQVEQEYRKQGLGTKFMKLIVKEFTRLGKTVLMGDTCEEDGKKWVESLGIGKIASHESESRLYMDDIDWELMQNWIDEGLMRAPDVTISFFQGIPDDTINAYCDFFTEALNSVPKEEIEWEAKITPESMREREQKEQARGTVCSIYVTVEKNKEISGVTEIFYNASDNFVVWQGLTAVLQKYQGRGLGKWLKATMTFFIRENYPDVQFIVTGNAGVNAPMLAINTKMGFKQTKLWTGYKFSLKELLSKYQV
ncbi:MAG: GNAT family N-acetyltransferase [Candidatus Kariarchaeaceae archaeon]